MVVSQQMEFADFLRYPDTQFTIANLQTRTLAFDLDIRSAQVRSLNPFATNPFGLDGITETTILDLPDDELLDRAKQRLDRFICFGLVEYFQKSLWLMSYALGWYPIVQPEYLNQAPARLAKRELSADVLSDAMQINQLDYQLYGYAEQVFEARYQQMLDDLGVEISSNDSHNLNLKVLSSLEQYFNQRLSVAVPATDSIDFVFSQAIQGHGWHRREGVIDRAIPFRWTGPDSKSTLSFRVVSTRHDYVLRLWVVNAVSPQTLNELTIWINEQEIPVYKVIAQGEIVVLQGIIPFGIVQESQGCLQFRLQVPQTLPLKTRYPNGQDARHVGLAIHRIQLFANQSQSADQSDSQTSYMFPFPEDDPDWITCAEFIESHIKWGDRLVAPAEFIHRLPQPFYSDSLTALVSSYRGELNQWIVIHKGYVQNSSIFSLIYLFIRFKPVFANPVFVIFANAPSMASIHYRSPHLKALIEIIIQQIGDRLHRKLKFER